MTRTIHSLLSAIAIVALMLGVTFAAPASANPAATNDFKPCEVDCDPGDGDEREPEDRDDEREPEDDPEDRDDERDPEDDPDPEDEPEYDPEPEDEPVVPTTHGGDVVVVQPNFTG